MSRINCRSTIEQSHRAAQAVRLSLCAIATLGGVLAVHPMVTYFGMPDILRSWCYAVGRTRPALLITRPAQLEQCPTHALGD
ncbi:hypothetical protein ACFVT5_37445 [Streptomyces sp. NPDC058001]|uniref:hypothetical protein n=1 Tax=Streptomyces sp. NPDC058001 TaxID=3346300 RepID=UPI0036E35546